VKHLSRQGFRVEELSLSRHEYYVDDWAHSPPGAVVLDLSPGSELGWDIVKRVKDNPATQDIPVLFYTLMAEEDSGSVVNLDYLTKPLGIEQLLDVLKRHGIKTGRRGPVSILIVDDEPGILEMHSQIVRTNLPDCRVITARDGVKALDCLRNNQVDLVLLDLLMPELDGFGVVKAMQAESLLREIPVIVLSAQVLTKREMQRLTQGVVGVLGKGMFSSAELFAKIESILGHNQRLGSEGQRLVFQAMGFIHEHYFEQISRADIAGHLNVNEQYLSRCFNRELGIGPMTYLSRYRIEQAKRLLEDGKMTITQVAMQVGLSSQSYFSRLFLQETGISPSAYQRGVRPTP
jgi:AraC-like DNA-binding protein/ActR/RegA family two-component response regulator